MTLDFHTNKKIVAKVVLIPTKRLRNKIVGFSTHLMKRIQKAIKADEIKVDKENLDMLSALGMADIPGLVEVEPQAMVAPAVFGRPGGAGRRY
ncbi:hypothetical protein REPUB_Repub10bG0057400 [Reevesia pubescens]